VVLQQGMPEIRLAFPQTVLCQDRLEALELRVRATQQTEAQDLSTVFFSQATAV
jgi:hypothetical protein